VDEANAAVAHLQPVDDGIILIAMPPAIPFPGYYRHDSADRPGHPDITYVEATYSPASTPGLVHEIAETITNPRYREHKAWVDDCDCELVDRCGPPPPGDSTPATLLVGESATANYQVPSMWSDAKNNGFGGCALSYTPDVNYYFVDGAGSLNHIWGALFGWGAIDDYGHPAGVTLSTLYSLAGPGAASWRKNRDDVFAVDSTGNVAHLWWDHPSTPGWNSWGKPTSYNVIYPPDAFSWRPLRVDVVVTAQSGSTRHLFRRYYENGYFSAWQDWGAPAGITIGSRPGVASWNFNRIDVFVLSTQTPHHMWHGYTTNGGTIQGWNDWGYPAGVSLVGGVDAASWGDNRIDVFALGLDGNVWHRTWDHGVFGGWVSWGSPSGIFLNRGVGAVGLGDGMVDAASGQYPYLYHRYYNAGLSSWVDEPWAYQYSTVDMSAW
jgi:hypothetical protein